MYTGSLFMRLCPIGKSTMNHVYRCIPAWRQNPSCDMIFVIQPEEKYQVVENNMLHTFLQNIFFFMNPLLFGAEVWLATSGTLAFVLALPYFEYLNRMSTFFWSWLHLFWNVYTPTHKSQIMLIACDSCQRVTENNVPRYTFQHSSIIFTSIAGGLN